MDNENQTKNIAAALRSIGFNDMDLMDNGVALLYRQHGGVNYSVCLVDYDNAVIGDSEAYAQLDRRCREPFFHTTASGNEQLFIVTFSSGAGGYDRVNQVREALSGLTAFWLVDVSTNALLIYEDAPGDFDGIRSIVENVVYGGAVIADTGDSQKVSPQGIKLTRQDIPFFTLIIISINIIVYLCVNVRYSGSTENIFVAHGGSYAPYIKENGEYYRLFTSMFMHVNFEHLANNMLCILVFGNIIERFWGRWKFLILYISGGLVSSITEYNYTLQNNENVVSVGASGAVYALIAALIILAIVNEDLRKRFNAATLLIVAIAAIVDGFFSAENIGNAAHIGGFVAGIVLAYVMDMISVYRKKT